MVRARHTLDAWKAPKHDKKPKTFMNPTPGTAPSPSTVPTSRAAKGGPWFTVAAAALNVLMNVMTFGDDSSEKIYAALQLITVTGLSWAGLIASIMGVVHTHNGARRGRRSARAGVWLASGYLLLGVLGPFTQLLLPTYAA